MRGVPVLVVLLACDAPPAPAPSPAPAPPTPTPVATTSSVELRWSNVIETEGCFFFSGPDGRDDRLQGTATLERSGPNIKLRVGSAEFDGTYQRGELALARSSTHEFDGTWLAIETIQGKYTEQEMRATYRYHECQSHVACPGRCEIRADLVLAR